MNEALHIATKAVQLYAETHQRPSHVTQRQAGSSGGRHPASLAGSQSGHGISRQPRINIPDLIPGIQLLEVQRYLHRCLVHVSLNDCDGRVCFVAGDQQTEFDGGATRHLDHG